MRIHKTVFLLFFIFLTLWLRAQSGQTGSAPGEYPWWYTLELGKRQFRAGSYGDALINFEDARRSREESYSRMEQDLILLLSGPNARPLGDSLEYVERYIAENHESPAAAALAELYHRVPKDSLKGSVNRALEEFDRLKAYPEAEFWLGETYRLEGELGLALRQYELAWEARALLEIPGFDAEILYRITDIHRIRREYQEMERRAGDIIEGTGPSNLPRDSLWMGNTSAGNQNPEGASNRVRAAMLRILENEGVDRYLSLYRHNNIVTEKAHRLLGLFYYASSRYIPAVEHLMFAFLIQNTVIIDELARRRYDFSFTTLESLIAAVSGQELHAFIEETEYFRTAYYLASALYAAGKTRPAVQLWNFLARSRGAGEWGERARRNPGPVIDRAIEMP